MKEDDMFELGALAIFGNAEKIENMDDMLKFAKMACHASALLIAGIKGQEYKIAFLSAVISDTARIVPNKTIEA